METDRQPYLSRVNVIVADMGKALAFYGLLGFRFQEDDEDKAYIEVKTPRGFRLSLWTRVSAEGVAPALAFGGQRVELAFRCPDREGVDSTYERVVTAGHKSLKPPFDAPWGQRYAYLEDPDGNLVGLESYAGHGQPWGMP